MGICRKVTQWGDTSSLTKLTNISGLDGYSSVYSLPIGYSSTYQTIASHPKIGNDQFINFAQQYDMASIEVRFRSGSPMKIFTIGYQQWGFATNSFNNSASLATISYPIQFTSAPIVITQKGDKNATAITDIGTSSWYNRQELVINVTTNSFRTAFYNRAGYSGCQWHAFGI